MNKDTDFVTRICKAGIAIALSFTLLTGCGGGGGGGGGSSSTNNPTGNTITGTVTAAPNQIALFEERSFARKFAGILIKELHAATIGLSAVPNATVELVRIGEDGNQIGGVINTATTNESGVYSLTTNETLASNLMVQVTNNGGNKIRAIVTSGSVDINPITEYVTSKLLSTVSSDSNYSLSDVTQEASNSLVGFVESLNIDLSTSVDANADIASMADSSINTEIGKNLFSLDLLTALAASVIGSSGCTDGAKGGWKYTFTNTGMTMNGSDTFLRGSSGCTIGLEESFSLTFAEIAAIDDIPFNCGSDNICNYNDLNKTIEGVDQDGREFKSTYTHIPGSNKITYVKGLINSTTGQIYSSNTEVIALSDASFNLDLSLITASSTINTVSCSGVTGGWRYTFLNTGITLTGSDTFNTDIFGNCTLGAAESFSLTFSEIAAIDDIPFNCGNDNICEFYDLNQIKQGTDQDGRKFTSTYSHIPGTNKITYVKTVPVSGVYTEVITFQ